MSVQLVDFALFGFYQCSTELWYGLRLGAPQRVLVSVATKASAAAASKVTKQPKKNI